MKAQIGSIVFSSWKKAAEAHGISYTSYMNRVHNQQWDRARAATTPIHEHVLHTANGITATRKDHAARLGVADSTLTKRLQRGATIEEALTRFPIRRKFLTAEERHAARQQIRKRRAARHKAAVAGYKNKPCKDCGGAFHTDAMEFDHCRGVKKFNLSKASSKSLLAIATEIAKCDIVCANCHRIRTNMRANL